MHATMRYYPGNTDLATSSRDERTRSDPSSAKCLASRPTTSSKLDDATVSITVCDDEAGTAESTRVAADWIRENMPDLAASPPMVSSGTVTLSA